MNLSHVQVNLTLKVNQAIVLDLEKYDFDLYKRILMENQAQILPYFEWKKKQKKLPDFSK